jgi:uncharacterized membrane protein
MKQYYTYENNEFKGPYDALAIIKKIRSGTLSGDTWVRDEENKDELVKNIPIFAEVLADSQVASSATDHGNKHLEFLGLIRAGIRFVGNNQMSLALSGLTILSIIIFGFLFSVIPFLGFFIGTAFGYISFSAFLFYILKCSRGQYVNFSHVLNRIKANFKNLFLAGLVSTSVLSLTLLLTLKVSSLFLLLIIPGLFVLAFFILAPLIIMDLDADYKTALTQSYHKIMSRGLDDVGIIFGMVVINFVATLAALAPLVFSLPITGQAIINIYEDI